MTVRPSAPRLADLGISPDRPLVLVDVDEVLGLFMKGFGDFLAGRGYEFRIERFALFQNVYRPGASEAISLEEGKPLFDDFFATACHEMEPAPGSITAMRRLSNAAEIIVLSNAPPQAELLRMKWLKQHGFDHPLILNSGPKGPIAESLIAQSGGRTAFIDDLIPNLDSVADHCPDTHTFQHVADTRLRPLAPSSDRHRRIDDWQTLGEAVEAAVRG